MKKHLSAVVLAVVLLGILLTVIPGCADDNKEIDTPESSTATTTASVITDDPSFNYQAPAEDYSGVDFKVLTRDTERLFKKEVCPDSSSDPVEQEVYLRNGRLEEQFKCTISPILVSENPQTNLTTTYHNIVSVNSEKIHLALGHMMYMGAESLRGTMGNWLDITTINNDYPWWNSSLIDSMTLNNTLFLNASDYCISSTDFTWLMVFNMEMAESLSVEVYDMVDDGSWTLANFTDIVQRSYVGSGDSTVDIKNDTFGFVTHYNTAITNWMFALDIPVSHFNDNEEVVLDLNSERMINATNDIYRLLFNGNGTLYFNQNNLNTYGIGDHDVAVATKFKNGEALFAALRILALENLRDSELQYGIIPFPKYNAEQESYHSHVDGRASLMAVPSNLTEEERDFVGVIIEHLSYLSYKDVMPVITSAALLGRYSSTEKAYQMLSLTLDSRTYSFAYVYHLGFTSSPYWLLSSMMSKDSSDFSGEWRKMERIVEREFEDIIDEYAGNE